MPSAEEAIATAAIPDEVAIGDADVVDTTATTANATERKGNAPVAPLVGAGDRVAAVAVGRGAGERGGEGAHHALGK